MATPVVGKYVGRFAPSPTGPLHFGSLLAATASYADALANNGTWLVRIEDVDEPRAQAHASEHILQTLHTHGFQWAGEVVVQSERKALYESALEKLETSNAIFACTCSRKMLETQPQNVSGERLYPGTCVHANHARTAIGTALRIAVPNETIQWVDRHLSSQSQQLTHDVGAFVVRRSDGLFSYQLAVVVDDGAQGVTHVVRGADLLTSTARQIYLQRLLGLSTPRYLHIPVAVNGRGEKLSKQTQASALDNDAALENLLAAWRVLNQPSAQGTQTVADFWAHCAGAWSVERLPKMLTLSA